MDTDRGCCAKDDAGVSAVFRSHRAHPTGPHMRKIALIYWSRLIFSAAVVAFVAVAAQAQPQQQKPAKPAAARVSSEELRRVSRVMTHFRQAGKDGRNAKRWWRGNRRRHTRCYRLEGPTLAGTDSRAKTLPRQVQTGGRTVCPRSSRQDGSSKRLPDCEQKVLDLQKQPNFTHEVIVAKADPAMKRLERLPRLPFRRRAEVLEESASGPRQTHSR